MDNRLLELLLYRARQEHQLIPSPFLTGLMNVTARQLEQELVVQALCQGDMHKDDSQIILTHAALRTNEASTTGEGGDGRCIPLGEQKPRAQESSRPVKRPRITAEVVSDKEGIALLDSESSSKYKDIKWSAKTHAARQTNGKIEASTSWRGSTSTRVAGLAPTNPIKKSEFHTTSDMDQSTRNEVTTPQHVLGMDEKLRLVQQALRQSLLVAAASNSKDDPVSSRQTIGSNDRSGTIMTRRDQSPPSTLTSSQVETRVVDGERPSKQQKLKPSPPAAPDVEEDWDIMYESLRLYHSIHGNCKVPHSKNPRLSRWVYTQRGRYSKQELTPDQIRKLDQAGFGSTLPGTQTWMSWYQQLVEFRNKWDHCRVPRKYPGLGAWVQTQRTEYKYLQEGRTSRMTKERIKMLEDVEFEWNVNHKRPKRAET